MSHWLKIYDHSKRGAQNYSWTFMARWWSFMTKEKVIHAKKNLCLIYVSLIENLWPFQARSAKPFMNIYGSLMLIYDPKKKVIHAKKNLCLIDWKFMTIPSAERKTIHEHLWPIDAHLWPKEKSHSWQEKFIIIFDQRKSHSWQEKFMIIFD